MKASSIIPDVLVINPECVRAYILYLRGKNKFEGHPHNPAQTKPLSPKTLQCHTRVLKAFSTLLYEEGYTSDNRLQHVKLPKAPDVIVEPLTPAEIDKVFSSIEKGSPTGIRNHAILVTMLDTGLRVSEVASITLSRLNLQDGYVKVMGKGSKRGLYPWESTLPGYCGVI